MEDSNLNPAVKKAITFLLYHCFKGLLKKTFWHVRVHISLSDILKYWFAIYILKIKILFVFLLLYRFKISPYDQILYNNSHNEQ
jgi:hypothetical protein